MLSTKSTILICFKFLFWNNFKHIKILQKIIQWIPIYLLSRCYHHKYYYELIDLIHIPAVVTFVLVSFLVPGSHVAFGYLVSLASLHLDQFLCLYISLWIFALLMKNTDWLFYGTASVRVCVLMIGFRLCVFHQSARLSERFPSQCIISEDTWCWFISLVVMLTLISWL